MYICKLVIMAKVQIVLLCPRITETKIKSAFSDFSTDKGYESEYKQSNNPSMSKNGDPNFMALRPPVESSVCRFVYAQDDPEKIWKSKNFAAHGASAVVEWYDAKLMTEEVNQERGSIFIGVSISWWGLESEARCPPVYLNRLRNQLLSFTKVPLLFPVHITNPKSASRQRTALRIKISR